MLLASWKAIRGKQAAVEKPQERSTLWFRSVDSGDWCREGERKRERGEAGGTAAESGAGFRRNAKYLSRIVGISL